MEEKFNHNGHKLKDHITLWTENGTRKSLRDAIYEDCNIICCRCGSEWGKHELTVVVQPKDECFTCGSYIDKRFYNMRGNFCIDCTKIAEMNAKLKIKRLEPKTYKSYYKAIKTSTFGSLEWEP